MARLGKPIALVTVAAVFACCAAPQPARAINPVKPICSLAGIVSTLAGKLCSAASHGKQVLDAGKKLLSGHLGGAVKTVLGGGSAAAKTLTVGAALAGIVAWVSGGAKFALHETASMISSTTRPQLGSTWFSGFYWRMAGVAALLTMPFLFAAAIQALVRSDLSLLLRSAFGYLPLGLLAVSIAAPLTTLLLAGTDELSRIVSSAAGNAETEFLVKAGGGAGALSLASHSPFIAFFVGLFAAAATLVLWCELLIRSAAVYVIVLMLPLFFAALVWPARRVWAIRAVEVLVALILSKFAIVAVLALGGAAIGHTAIPSMTQMLAGATLVLLAAFSPWALLRLLPLHELAAGAVGGLRMQSQGMLALGPAEGATEIAETHSQRLLEEARFDAEPAAQTLVSRLDARQERERGDGAAGREAETASGAGPGAEIPSGAGPDAESPSGAGPDAEASPGQPAGDGADVAPQATPAPDTLTAASGAPPGTPAPSPQPDSFPAGASSTGDPPPKGELPASLQAENWAWRTLHFPRTPEWRPVDEPDPPPHVAPDRPDDHDPLPPAQKPDDGSP